MNFERMIQDVITVYQSNCGSKLSEDTAKHIIRAFLSVRDTEKVLADSSRHLFQSVFENSNFYNKTVYPCDVVELRSILTSNKIKRLTKVFAFSNSASDRLLKDQKVRVILDLDPKKLAESSKCEVAIFGGLAIFETNKLDIKNHISSIVVENSDMKTVAVVEGIVRELCPTCPVYTSSFIPGMDKYKFARNVRLFEVHLPSLGIFHEKSRASDPVEALRQILAIRWDRHPDKKDYRKKPDNYTAEYWKNSGFMSSIVREIGRKHAQLVQLEKGLFDPTNPPSGKAIHAVMLYDGNIYYDTQAAMHADVVESNGLDANEVVDGGFIINGNYKPQMSQGGWSAGKDDPIYQEALQERAKNGKPPIVAQASQQMSPKLNLTPQEQTIFSVLLDINQKMGLGVTFRVAGGWVRDKLLGVPSDDIDIALDKMTGQQFVNKAMEYKKANPQSPINVDSAYVVKQNAEKSKHLETTALDIGGLKIDFVNLRDESYGDSRIPTMQLSDDPKIDAQRRDLTINSMFYNVNTQQVEDYVGGLQDLQTMTLRTPLDPTKTFMDDPLRMLRVFRFFSKFPNAKIDPATMQAMANPSVHDAYRKKVSPERAGPEILKMFGAQRPAEAIRLLFETGMDKAVFDVPEMKNLNPLTMNQRNRHHKFNLLEHTLRVVENLDKIMKQKNVSGKDRILMLMAAVFHDYGKAHPEIGKEKENDPGEYGYVGHEDVSGDIADSVLKRIGIGEDDRKFVSVIIRQHMRPHTDSWTNKSMGKFIRDTEIPGNDRKDMYKFVMMHAQADTMAKSEEGDQADYDLKEQHINQMQEYLNRPEPIQMKPLVDGVVLQQMFPNLSPKPPKGLQSFIKYIQTKLQDEQFAGNIVNQQQAIAFVEKMRGEIETMYGGKQAESWYGRAKIADASSGSSSGAGGRLATDSPSVDMENVKRMVYREPGSSSMISVGDRFRSKGLGVAFEGSKDSVYKVVAHANGYVTLQDDTGKKHKVEIGVELPAKFIKV